MVSHDLTTMYMAKAVEYLIAASYLLLFIPFWRFVNGGPAALAREYGFTRRTGCVDACHLCYLVRKALIDRFPQYLAPRQVYGY